MNCPITQRSVWRIGVMLLGLGAAAALAPSLGHAQDGGGAEPGDGGPRVIVARKAAGTDQDATLPRLPDPPAGGEAVSRVEPSRRQSPSRIELPLEHHAWARFAPGAWRTVRTITESFDPSGKFIGRSETTLGETLIAVSDGAYTIETTTVLEIGGKSLRGAPQRATMSLLTDATSPVVEARVLPAVSIEVQGREVACQRWELTLGEGAERRLETLFYSADPAPHILRRESTGADSAGESLPLQTTTRVVRVDAPVELDGEIVPGEHVEVSSLSGALRVERSLITSSVVPGGLVSSATTELDAEGRRVRWSTTDLVDCGQAGEAPSGRRRWRLFRRRAD